MKMPSGSVPQFLVLTELQRRTRMEREAQGGDAPEQSTVAQDAVAAAGVPQGGVAQMAQALAPKTDMAGNTGIAAMAPQAAPAPVQRMQEGGLSGISRDVRAYSPIMGGASLRASTPRPRLAVRDGVQYAQMGDGSLIPLGELGFSPADLAGADRPDLVPPAPVSVPTADFDTTPGQLLGPYYDPDRPGAVAGGEDAPLSGRRTPPALASGLDDARPRIEGTTPARPFGAYADLLDAPTTAEQVFGDLPPARPEVSDDPTGRGERRERRDGSAGLSPRNPFAFIEEAITQPPTYGPADGSTRGRTETPEMLAQRVARSFEAEAEAADLETAPRPTRERLPGLGGPPDDRARGPSDETRELAEQFEEEAEAADREIADLPGGVAPDLGIETPAAPGGGGGGGAGGAGSRTGTLGDVDRMYEQDKWLSLARFGLGLMASSQPTLGGAIGEAGGAALDSLGQAREDLLQRRMAEAQLARRGGGGGGGVEALPIGLATMYDDEIASLREQLNSLAVANNPTLRTQIADRLEGLEAQQNYTRSLVLASRGIPPRTTEAPDSIPDFSD
jgi:hypothetical protein